MKKNYYFPFLFLYFFLQSFFVFAEDTISAGLKFNSHEVAVENRTGIAIGQNDPFKFSKTIELSFEFQLEPAPFFGNIVRIVFDNKKKLDLSYSPPVIENGQQSLNLVLGKRDNFSIPIFNQAHHYGNWLNASIKLDRDQKKAEFCFMDTTYQLNFSPKSYEGINAVELFFGKQQDGKFVITDVAEMSVRNIKLSLDDKKSYFWPLNELNGTIAQSSQSPKAAYIENPVWAGKYHYLWQQAAQFKADFKPGMIYNEQKHQVEIINQIHEIHYVLPFKQLSDLYYEKPLSIPPSYINAFVNPVNQEKVAYDFRHGELTAFNHNDSSWAEIQASENEMTHWHHNILYDSLRDEYLTFGGYGYFKYKNDFLRFDKTQKAWEKVPFSGDSIPPRYLSAKGYLGNNQYLIFGGMGNYSGRQEMGVNTYQDLYLVDLSARTIKLLWEKEEESQDAFVPAKSIVIDQDKQVFYALTFFPFNQETQLQLRKFNLNSGEEVIVSDKIPFEFKDIRADVDLFYDQDFKKFIAVTRSTIEGMEGIVQIYTLDGPPLAASIYEASLQNEKQTSGFSPLWGGAIAIILLVLLITYFFQKRHRKPEEPAAIITTPSETLKTIPASQEKGAPQQKQESIPETPVAQAFKFDFPRKNAIYLFGGLEVFDREGQDISHKITPKLKQILLLIICYPYNHGRGISSSEMTELVWPTATKSSGKNNRSISIRRLRLILEEIEGVEIVHDKQEWKLELTKEAFCDLNRLLQLKKQLKQEDNRQVQEEIMALTKRGPLPSTLRAEWLDDINNFIVSDTIKLLTDFAVDIDRPNLKLQIADAILHLDDLDEQGLEIKLKTLLSMNKVGQAQSELNRFKKRHQNFFNDEYKLNLEDFQ
ncbi:hypothetical protein [Persicobacter diffluens]|uniref:DNA-binding transcriptional activator n=1 Tax=Persicobacter diffluens TaxID=981 RepID=A0AAN4VZP4_9BACT|nr:hypothetical protein PEDI_36110 [Persicobacter diffluens]